MLEKSTSTSTTQPGNLGEERMLSRLLDSVSVDPFHSVIDFDRQSTDEASKPVFLPSQRRIKNMCENIRRDWTEHVFNKRGATNSVEWMVPEVAACTDSGEVTDE